MKTRDEIVAAEGERHAKLIMENLILKAPLTPAEYAEMHGFAIMIATTIISNLEIEGSIRISVDVADVIEAKRR